MVDLVYCSTDFFDILLLYYYINLSSLIISYLFSRDICMQFLVFLCQILYFLLHSELSLNYFIVHFLRPLLFYQRFCQSNRQLFCSFLNFSFSSSFKCICSSLQQIIQHDQEVSGFIHRLSSYLNFYRCLCSYFYQEIRIHELLQMFNLQAQFNKASFFMCYN